ncbi:MAG: DUF4124 domain-containing protein [Steroidobacteraceae bacterium]
MRKIAVTTLAALLACAATQASDVFVTKDAQGRVIYTDRPDSLPAQKVQVATKATDTAEVQKRYQQEMSDYAKADKAATQAAKQATDARQAAELTAADQAKRCAEARDRYQTIMSARRVYQEGATPADRRYLDDAEIDAARADAKQVMDQFCNGQ